jgi:DeoR/GlpR family transcriptional regulator of sugar metabolism
MEVTMLTQQRKSMILNTLKRDGQVVAKDLARTLGLSEDTIRRDMRELAADGLLQRVHGGALPASPATADLSAKRLQSPDAKRALGRAGAAMLRPGLVVFVDGGTTTLELVRQLPGDLAATIITHSPIIATALIDHPRIEVVLIGGRLFRHSGVCVGAATVDMIAQFRADLYFMGVTGVHAEYGLSTGDMEEATVKRAFAAAAAESVVMATAEKLGAVSPYLIMPASRIGTLIIPFGTDLTKLAPFKALGTEIIEAGSAASDQETKPPQQQPDPDIQESTSP